MLSPIHLLILHRRQQDTGYKYPKITESRAVTTRVDTWEGTTSVFFTALYSHCGIFPETTLLRDSLSELVII